LQITEKELYLQQTSILRLNLNTVETSAKYHAASHCAALPNGAATLLQATPTKAIYSMDGRRQKGMRRGLNIVRMGDGTARKIVRR